MTFKHYGVLKGRVVDSRREGLPDDSPHYQIHVNAAGDFRAAVNVLSGQRRDEDGKPLKDKDRELLYVVDEDFRHPILDGLAALRDGFNPVPSKPGGLALDFVRGSLFDRNDLRTLPPDVPGKNNDLEDLVEHYTQRAMNEQDSRIYVFGDRWGPERGKRDKVFHFEPGDGIHEVHMNQGNAKEHEREDGVWQDGGLIFEFPAAGRWVAIFLAFQSQKWHTDDKTGHALPGVPAARPGGAPAAEEPDHDLRIAAALVNPVGPDQGRESVTLINTTAGDVDLTDWAIIDSVQQPQRLPAETLRAGDAIRIQVVPPVALGNRGGTITLVNKAGLKVDSVAYTADQAKDEGRTLVF